MNTISTADSECEYRSQTSLKSFTRKTVDESSRLMREAFENLLRESRFPASKGSIETVFNEISENLKNTSPSLYDESQLARSFESLMNKRCNKRQYGKSNWTEIETNYLISVLVYYCGSAGKDIAALCEKDWQCLEQVFPTKSAYQIRKRWNSLLRIGFANSPWTAEEDKLLKRLVKQYGAERQWKKIAEQLNSTFQNGTFRHSRQCRERWLNYIDPKINKGKWSFQDDLNLMKMFVEMGRKWSAISKILGNRTENAVKNRWKSLIRQEGGAMNPLNENLGSAGQPSELEIAKNFIEKAKFRTNEPEAEESNNINDEYTFHEEEQDETFESPFDSMTPDEGLLADRRPLDQVTQLVCSQGIPTAPAFFPPEQTSFFQMAEPVQINPKETREFMYSYSTFSNCSGVYDGAVSTNQIWNFKMENLQHEPDLNADVCPFKLSNGSIAAQRFKNEIQRPESQVFFALVDINDSVIQVLDRVSESNWPNDLDNQFMQKQWMYGL